MRPQLPASAPSAPEPVRLAGPQDAAERTAKPAPGTPGAGPASSAQNAGEPQRLPLAQIEAQWCSHGMQAHRQGEQSINDSHATVAERPDYWRLHARRQALDALPTSQAQEQVRQRLLRRWADLLRQRGDARSLSVADSLDLALLSGSARDPIEQALEQRALSGNDAFVLQVWLKSRYFCAVGPPCPPQASTRWSRIEPDNALAWMPASVPGLTMSDAQWEGLARARYAKSAELEYAAGLLALLNPLPPGLELEVGLTFLEDQAWLIGPSADSLKRQCEQHRDQPKAMRACAHAAELFWNSPSPSLRARLAAAELAELTQQTDQPLWADRLQALAQLDPAVVEEQVQGWRPSMTLRQRCDQQPARRQRLQRLLDAAANSRAPA